MKNTSNQNRKKVSFWVTEEQYKKLQNLSLQKGNNISGTLRDLMDKQLNVTAAKDDIDFIRKQIREELEIMIKPQVNRLAKLLMRIGMMTISFCYFTSKIIFHFVPFRDRESYEELMANAKHNAAAYLNVRDASLDAAFKEFDENNE